MLTRAAMTWPPVGNRVGGHHQSGGRVHAFTVCYFGSEEFLPETPYVLALIEIEAVNTLLLTRLMGSIPCTRRWIGSGCR